MASCRHPGYPLGELGGRQNDSAKVHNDEHRWREPNGTDIGGHFADRQIKKAPQVGQGAYSSRSRQNDLFPRDNTTQCNITYLSESTVRFQTYLIDFIDMTLSLQRWGAGSYSVREVVNAVWVGITPEGGRLGREAPTQEGRHQAQTAGSARKITSR